ncbi:MAG TPA: hypothetical protein VGO91_10695 [Pyrinomonadaceae bacterium]|jgi:hypothetical protein|nr:hypothetical protein [Pyrinomonadaceae bacterium]
MERFQMSKRLRPDNLSFAALLPLIFISSLMLSACATSGQPNANEPSTANAPTTTTETSRTIKTETVTTATPHANGQPASESAQPNAGDSPSALPLPTLAEAQSAVARIYKNAVTIDTAVKGGKPFVVGDFNNDGVEDLAVVVRPGKGMLAEINSEYANWIVEDVTKVQLPVERNGRQVLAPNPGPVRIEQNDQLLVIIHGYQKEAWRNSQARQTYLLKNAVGENMQAMPIKYALAGASAKNPHVTVNGDVIKETRRGDSGFIYWTGSKYAWRQ